MILQSIFMVPSCTLEKILSNSSHSQLLVSTQKIRRQYGMMRVTAIHDTCSSNSSIPNILESNPRAPSIVGIQPSFAACRTTRIHFSSKAPWRWMGKPNPGSSSAEDTSSPPQQRKCYFDTATSRRDVYLKCFVVCCSCGYWTVGLFERYRHLSMILDLDTRVDIQ